MPTTLAPSATERETHRSAVTLGDIISEPYGLMVCYGWRTLGLHMLTAIGMIVAGAVGAIRFVQAQPRDLGVDLMIVLTTGFLAFGVVALVDYVVVAAQRSVALAIGMHGIVLRQGPLLSRRPAWGRTSSQAISWPQIVTMTAGTLSLETSHISGEIVIPTTVDVPMVDIELCDGTHVVRDMIGVDFDPFRMAEAVRRFAPKVVFSQGEIANPVFYRHWRPRRGNRGR